MISGKFTQISDNETGAALLMNMVMLVILTLIGTAAINTSSFEIKMSGAEKNKKAAFYAAEAGIEHAKILLDKAYDSGTESWNIDGIEDAGSYDSAVELISEKALGNYIYTVKVWESGRLHIRSESSGVKSIIGKSGIEVTYSANDEQWLRDDDSDRYQHESGPRKDANVMGEKYAIETFDKQLDSTPI